MVGVTPNVAYILVFAVAAGFCIAGAVRARRVEDAETRWGLIALLVTSAGWAGTHAGLLAVPGEEGKRLVYLVGLVFGFSTVFAWLYFCSAYTGRTYHRRRSVRLVALALYVAVVAVKVTNPYHHLYFTTAVVQSPFPHLAIRQGVFHWVVTGISYTLAAVGMFALFEAFVEAEYDAAPLAALVGLAGAPVVLDVVGYVTPVLIDMIHAPLGVAAFTLGVLFVFEDRFFAVQLTEGVDGATVFLDDRDRIREYSHAARRLFPGLDGSVGDPVGALPALAAALDADGDVVDVDVDGERRHYVVGENAFDVGQGSLGRIAVFSDVTRIERQRRELDRHDRQLEDFSSGLRHEFRNAATVIQGNVRHATERLEDGDVETARDALRTATGTTDRLTRLVDDFATLAEYGQTMAESRSVGFERTVRTAWADVDTADATLVVDAEGTVTADPTRFELLFERAFEFHVGNGAGTVVVARRDGGFTVTGDGDAPTDDRTRYFDYDDAVPNAALGTALPMVRTLARVHGWRVDIDPGYREGVRLVVEWEQAAGS
jgi:signal transduction histidine kinase